jgi:hypothetical protein
MREARRRCHRVVERHVAQTKSGAGGGRRWGIAKAVGRSCFDLGRRSHIAVRGSPLRRSCGRVLRSVGETQSLYMSDVSPNTAGTTEPFRVLTEGLLGTLGSSNGRHLKSFL